VNLLDRYYTPDWVADEVAELAAPTGSGLGRVVADPAAGDGALLTAVTKHWPDAQCLASDIDPLVVARLRRRRPDWWVSQCNLLNPISRSRSRLAATDVDTVVLNPPFSSRGASRVEIEAFGSAIRCSPAAAFALLSLERVKLGGRLVALLPASLMTSDKDAAARDLLFSEGTCGSVRDLGSRSFSGVVTRVLLKAAPSSTRSRSPRIAASLQRGRVPMYKRQVGGRLLPLIHTTDLLGDVVGPHNGVTSATTLPLAGPAVLLPRVGYPRPSKIVRFDSTKMVALSDCVFAVKVNSNADAVEVQRRLRMYSDDMCDLYRSSCAPYVTSERLKEFLGSLAVQCG
jgi:predicted RNA methylase